MPIVRRLRTLTLKRLKNTRKRKKKRLRFWLWLYRATTGYRVLSENVILHKTMLPFGICYGIITYFLIGLFFLLKATISPISAFYEFVSNHISPALTIVLTIVALIPLALPFGRWAASALYRHCAKRTLHFQKWLWETKGIDTYSTFIF